MKNTLMLFILLVTSLIHAAEYPRGPLTNLTPGELCSTPTSFRYPENIPYCERDVAVELKEQVFSEYRRAGFVLPSNARRSYKIDHFLPLCAGGANTLENLWPQHITIYPITDPIEELGCKKLALGKITQKDLISLIKKAKLDLSQAPIVLNQLDRL